MTDDDVKKKVADELRSGVIHTNEPISESLSLPHGRFVIADRKRLGQLADLLDPPPPQEPEIWARRGMDNGLIVSEDHTESVVAEAPSWLGPERERVSVTKKAETDALLKSLHARTGLIRLDLPVDVFHALQAFDEAHRPRT